MVVLTSIFIAFLSTILDLLDIASQGKLERCPNTEVSTQTSSSYRDQSSSIYEPLPSQLPPEELYTSLPPTEPTLHLLSPAQ